MFGMLEAIFGFLNWVIGRRADAASASGSLHAKVADVKNYLSNTIYTYLSGTIYQRIVPWQSKTPKFFFVNSLSNNFTTILNISGSGFLTGVSVYQFNGNDVNLRITIDGTIVLDGALPFVSNLNGIHQNSLSSLHRFNSSLKIEVDDLSYVFISYLLD